MSGLIGKLPDLLHWRRRKGQAEKPALSDKVAGISQGTHEQLSAVEAPKDFDHGQELSPEDTEQFIETLKERFTRNDEMRRETARIFELPNVGWSDLEKSLRQFPKRLWTLNQMEKTGGEPDVLYFNIGDNEFIFIDMAKKLSSERWVPRYQRDEDHIRHDLEACGRENVIGRYSDEHIAKELAILDEAGNLDKLLATWGGAELLTERDYNFLSSALMKYIGRIDSDNLVVIANPSDEEDHHGYSNLHGGNIPGGQRERAMISIDYSRFMRPGVKVHGWNLTSFPFRTKVGFPKV